MNIELEITLNRGWIYAKGIDEPIGEKNFTVPAIWLIDVLEQYWPGEDPDDFLNVYDPDVEGEFIYRLAKREGVVIDEEYNFSDEDIYVDLAQGTMCTYETAFAACREGISDEMLWYELSKLYEDNINKLIAILPDWFSKELHNSLYNTRFNARYCSLEDWYKRGGNDKYLNI